MRRQKDGFIDYTFHLSQRLFDYVLINYYDNTFLRQIEFVLENELGRISNRLDVFVIMAFDDLYKDVYSAMKIAGSLVNRNMRIERVSETRGDYIITEEIKRLINESRLILCDLSEERPNVYYELGYACARNKTIIRTAKKGANIHFDENHENVNFYSTEIELMDILVDLFKFYQL